MRKIEELLKFELNEEAHQELECQILFDNRKAKIEEESLLDEYDDDVDTVSWESMEISAWDLMKTKGLNWKLFSVWIESLIYIHGWDEVIYCFQAVNEVFKSKLDILLKQEDKQGCVEFFDKALSRALVLQPIQDEDTLHTFLGYKKNSPQSLIDSLSLMDKKSYEEFLNIYKTCIEIISSFHKLSKDVNIHFSKILDMFSQLYDVLNVFAKNFLDEDEEDEENESENEEDEDMPNHFDLQSRDAVYSQLAAMLSKLQEIDHQNIAIPLLRKIMRWQNKNISEILNEINDKEGAYFLLKFLMD